MAFWNSTGETRSYLAFICRILLAAADWGFLLVLARN